MKMMRMQILLVAVMTFVWNGPLQAQRGPYPFAPVKIVVGFPPGGGVDVVARLIAQKMTSVWGQQVVVRGRQNTVEIERASANTRGNCTDPGILARLLPHCITASRFSPL